MDSRVSNRIPNWAVLAVSEGLAGEGGQRGRGEKKIIEGRGKEEEAEEKVEDEEEDGRKGGGGGSGRRGER